MIATMQGRLIAAGVLLLAIAGALVWFGVHERAVGAAGVQAKWDLANAAQTQLAVEASESARHFEQSQAASFSLIANTYLKAANHDYPSIADGVVAGVAAGTVRLRHDCPPAAAGSDHVSSATAASRERDAAATQALADRVSAAIAAVRAGDAADARERQLGAQVTALQAILRAERHGQ